MSNKPKKRSVVYKALALNAIVITDSEMNNKGHKMNGGDHVNMCIDTVIFNIGGAIFETHKSTLEQRKSLLGDRKWISMHYRAEKNDYFFDRDPDMFRATLNYLRTGELHIPLYVCGPAAKMELEFWGVTPNKLQRCCWTCYNDGNTTTEALNQLDEDRRNSLMMMDTNSQNEHYWKALQLKIWQTLDNQVTSFPAKLYGLCCVIFVAMSITSFIAGTTAAFKVRLVSTALDREDNVSYSATNSTTNMTTSFTEPDQSHSQHHSQDILRVIELACLIFFSTQFVVHFTFAPNKLRFITSAICIIDMIALLPDYIERVIDAFMPDSSDVKIIIICRLVRIFRIFRLIKHVPGLWILLYTLKASIGELMLLTCFMSVGILVFASAIYFVEDHSTFESIPHGFWWAIITMTTVGYGDMCPKTPLGKVVGSLCAMSGLLMVGFSVPALVNNFLLYRKYFQYSVQQEKVNKLRCKNSDEESAQQKSTNKSSQNDLIKDVALKSVRNNSDNIINRVDVT